jgi:hypothetical protein
MDIHPKAAEDKLPEYYDDDAPYDDVGVIAAQYQSAIQFLLDAPKREAAAREAAAQQLEETRRREVIERRQRDEFIKNAMEQIDQQRAVMGAMNYMLNQVVTINKMEVEEGGICVIF